MHKSVNVSVGGPVNTDVPKIYNTKFLKPGIPFSQQVTDADTKYVIKHNFVLDGDVTIPENCVLEFDGGSINTNSNIITGQNTKIIYYGVLKDVINGDGLSGSWSDEINKHAAFIELESIEGYDELLSPSDMQSFIQKAVDYASSKGKNLIFPKNKTFTIAIPGFPSDSWESYSGSPKGGNGIKMPSNIIVDLNGCTIQVEGNHYAGYNIVYFDQNCQKSTLKNGVLIGDRQNHTKSQAGATDEYCYGIGVRGAKFITIENVEVCELTGDGINNNGYCELNTAVGNLKGTDFVAYSNVAGFNAISGFKTIADYFNIVKTRVGISKWLLCFIAPFSDWSPAPSTKIGCKYMIVYYDSEQTVISSEVLLRGEPCTIPDNATYLKVAVWCDDFNEFTAISTSVLWGSVQYPTEYSYVDHCYIHDVGRNGGCVDNARHIYISNTKILRVFGTNNFVGIDLENYGGDFTYDIHIDNCYIDTGYYASGGDILITAGRDIFINNCKTKNISGRFFHNVHVSNCFSNSILFVYETDNTGIIGSGSAELASMCTVQNCIGNYIVASSGIIENCIIDYGTDRGQDYANSINSNPVIYRNCTININVSHICDLIAAVYDSCRIYSDISYFTSYAKFLRFVNCVLKTKDLRIIGSGYAEFIGCDILYTPGNRMGCIRLSKMIGCSVKFAGDNAYDAFNIETPNNGTAVIENNTFDNNGHNVRYALLTLRSYSNSSVISNIIIKSNHFIISNGASVITQQGDKYSGSHIMFIDNVIDSNATTDIGNSILNNNISFTRNNNRYINKGKTSDYRIVDLDGGNSSAIRKGTTDQRPVGIHTETVDGESVTVGTIDSSDIGFEYFDTTIIKPIYVKTVDSNTGTVTWVDATGATV